MQKQKNNKEGNNNISSSLPNISNSTTNEFCDLRRSKSESDIRNISNPIPPKPDLRLHGKSERNLQTIYSNATSTPITLLSPSSMENSMFSIISDTDQIKVPIVGYEVMEERSRFTVS